MTSSALPLRVMKFGGSSLSTPERLGRVLDLVHGEASNARIALVVSAMGDTTDLLLEAVDVAATGDGEGATVALDRIADVATTNGLVVLQQIEAARGMADRPEILAAVRELLTPLRRLLYGVSLVRETTPQTRDLVMSFGERLSATVVAHLLTAGGLPAVYVDARDWTVTDDAFGNATVDWPASAQALTALRATWPEGAVPVCTGFLGQTPDGRTTTLGRNGSDYTATLFARGLGADEVVRWTDVSGVMTADPALVGDAYPLERLSYMEALELANFGARVFHPRTMIPLIESGIPMRIRNTMEPQAPGTRVDHHGAQDADRPTSVTSLEHLAMIGIEWRRVSIASQARISDRVLHALGDAGVTVWMANQAAHGQAIAVVVPEAEADRARASIEADLERELANGDVEPLQVRRPVTLLTLVAEAMGHTVNVAGRFFHALGAVGVNVRAIAQGASSRSVSCVIDAAETSTAVRTVHGAFNFAQQRVSVLLYGRGTVGAELIEQARAQHDLLAREHHVDLRIVGIVTSRASVFEPDGLDLSFALDRVAAASARATDDALLDQLRRLPTPVLVDCTAAPGFETLYAKAFDAGVHVVGANKKPLTVDAATRNALMRRARDRHRTWRYETTVGASLPVIDTIKNLVRTGDRVLRIEGSFSGTLGYLTNELNRGVPLATAVRDAHARGYTEPNPADDLTGTDVARKALILARELGYDLELDAVNVRPLVPANVLACDGLDALFAALETHATEFDAWLGGIREAGQTLRYLARIVPDGAGAVQVEVGPVGVPSDHAATRLRGAEAFVAFTTERYREYPLLVQGAGAGGAVTAAGVLADVLEVPRLARAR